MHKNRNKKAHERAKIAQDKQRGILSLPFIRSLIRILRRSFPVSLIVLLMAGILSVVSGANVMAASATPRKVVPKLKKLSKKLEKGVTTKRTGIHAYWKKGLHIDGRYEKLQIKIGGSAMVDGGTIDPDANLNTGFPSLQGSQFDLRRLRANGVGKLSNFLEARLDIDFANVREIKDNWVRFPTFPILRHTKIGHLKEPLSLEELTSSSAITFMERALPTQAFSPSRNLGFRYTDTALDDRMTYALGSFAIVGSIDDLGDSLDRISKAQGVGVTGRLTFLPWITADGNRFGHLGLAYSHRFDLDTDPATRLRFRARPESNLTDVRLVDTGRISAESVDLINPELAFVWGPLSLQAELYHAFVKANEDYVFWGYYLYASYFLTGETRRYKKSNGTFTRTKPIHDFHPSKAEWGAWELGLRFSYLDLDDKNIQGGKEQNVTVGLNWYLNPNVRLMFNYIHADVENSPSPAVREGNVDIFQLRFQFAF